MSTSKLQGLAHRMIPAYTHNAETTHGPLSIEGAIQTLSQSHRQPVALELSGTADGRQLSLRATTPFDLEHGTFQLRACYPQAKFQCFEPGQDPLDLQENETVEAIELMQGRAAYFPLREFTLNARATPQQDPLLGILAALDNLPEQLRLVAQIALIPAPEQWSQAYQRKALQHSLEPEREKKRAMAGKGGGPSSMILVLGACLLLILYYQKTILALFPGWVQHAISQLLSGHMPQLTPVQQTQLIIGGVLIIASCLGAIIACSRLLRFFFAPPLYDQKEVARKTAQSAYRVRLRLFAISPKPARSRSVRWALHARHLGTALFLRLPSDLPCCAQDAWGAFSHTYARRHTPAGAAIPSSDHTFRAAVQAALRQGWHTWWHASETIAWWQICRRETRQANGWAPWWRYARVTRPWRITRAILQRQLRAWTQHRYWKQQRERHLHRLIVAYRQYHLATGNYFRPRALSRRQAERILCPRDALWNAGGWWQGLKRSPHLLIGQEIASLWHMPAFGAIPELALVEQSRMHTILVPPQLAKTAGGYQLGYSEHAGHRLPVNLPADCIDKHMLIVGRSGEGKSTCMEHLSRVVMQHGGGMMLLDPHGDLVDHVLPLVPPERQDDVVVIDLSDTEFAVGLNPLDVTLGRGRDKAISDLLKPLAHIWVGAWGSRMENAFEYALRTLYEANMYIVQSQAQGVDHQYTLLDVMQVLTDESFCHALLEHVEDPYIHRWWHLYYDPLSMTMQRDRSDPVLSKVAKFESYIARRIVGQPRSTLQFSEYIQQRKLIFFKLAKGVVGEDMAKIMGATLLGLLQIALEEQGNLARHDRQPLTILVDEFQVLKGVDWASLAELRKYGATFYLATQSLEYLREEVGMLATVMANVKQYMAFHMSAKDAEILAPELGLQDENLLNIDSYACYAKFTYQARRQPTFSLHLNPPPIGDLALAQELIKRSRQRYGTPAALIDERLKTALIAALSAQPQSAKDEKRKEPDQPKRPHPRRKAQEKRDREAQNNKNKDREHSENNLEAASSHTDPMPWEETVQSLPEDQESEDQEQEREE